MTKTAPAAKLHTLSTAELIAQYDIAVSSHNGRNTSCGPRQKRINAIVDLIAARDDEVANAWLEAK